VIKKYPNRRLYCTERSSYITLEQLGEQIRRGEMPLVRHQKDGTDATAEVYAAIIMELVKKRQITAAALIPLIRLPIAVVAVTRPKHGALV